jgi:murein DD-endopeptidase MepM/ murein hydrolase activator NlpD
MRSLLTNSVILLFACVSLLAACAPTGVYHTVQPGQTLYRIAKTYEISESRLADINDIKDPTQLKANQRLYIPGVTHSRKVPITSKTTSLSSRAPSDTPATKKQPTATVSKPVTKKPSVKSPVSAAKPAKGFFVWPVKGKVLNKFGKKNKNIYKGIEIGASKGTIVIAAASGKVIYSGSAIPGYGNLVILEHSDSYFSVYGYNQKNLVKMNDYVGQGDKIALSGLPPNGQSARLHFEIRKGKSAVNPILYLP